jgi:hypothetical protein
MSPVPKRRVPISLDVSTPLTGETLTNMATRRLFDSVPLHNRPSLYSEPPFAFLSRADSPAWARVRELIEAWYAAYPDQDGDLRARFRKADIRQHVPAWWELYTYTLFRRLNYAVTVHPAIPGVGGRPDFLVEKDGAKAYVECAVLFADGSRISTDSEAWVKDCIDAARNPDFVVGVRFERLGSRRPKKSQITRPIEDWLGSLDYDSVRDAASAGDTPRFPQESFEFAGFQVRLTALPVHPDTRGKDIGRIGFGPGNSAFPIQSVGEIREILKEKAHQCRGVDAPLVVGILNQTTFATLDLVEQALFGSDVIRHNHHSARLMRAEDGYWHPGPPRRGSSISAIMFGQHIGMTRVAVELPTLWLNPWAHMPFENQVRLETHSAYDTGEGFVAAHAGVLPADVFDVLPNWPEL